MKRNWRLSPRLLATTALLALTMSSLSVPESAEAQRRGRGGGERGGGGSMRHAGGGGGGVGRGGSPGRGGNRAAYQAGKSQGRRQGYNVGVHQGYRAGVHTGYRAGVYHNPWAFRGPSIWVWHPVGFFVATLATTAVIVSVVNSEGQAQSSGNVYYDQGVYYQKTSDGYKAIPPPPGAEVASLPEGYTSVSQDNVQYGYYQGDFYVEQNGKYVVAKAPVGATVPYIPDSATETTSDGQTTYDYNGVQYQAVSLDGDTSYIVSKS